MAARQNRPAMLLSREPALMQDILDASRNPYIAYVAGKLVTGQTIDHEVQNWDSEMRTHIAERFPSLQPENIADAIIFAATDAILERQSRGEA